MKLIAITHRADFDGIFSREIARKALGLSVDYIGWDYGDPIPVVEDEDVIYMIDISVAQLMDHPNLIWIDHHKSAIEEYSDAIPGIRIDGVAACRLAWQYFFENRKDGTFPTKQDFVDRQVKEPYAVRLAGEYDIWDKRNPDADIFQLGLRSVILDKGYWDQMLSINRHGIDVTEDIVKRGRVIQPFQEMQNTSIIKNQGFTINFEGKTFLAVNTAKYNSLLFTAGLKPEHDGCLGFHWDHANSKWTVSLYGVPGKPDEDFTPIALKYGGGGHKQACGFLIVNPPWLK